MRGTLEQRFWAKVDRRGPDECWLWTATVVGKGYGSMWPGGPVGTKVYAHRLSWTLHFGEIPDGLFVCHRCDTPRCVNPTHLFLGTNLDNVRDMIAKGRKRQVVAIPERRARGERQGRAKLTRAAVREIRRRAVNGIRGCDLAAEFGLSRQSISEIVNRKTWAWLDDKGGN